jgi:hypothetical protein
MRSMTIYAMTLLVYCPGQLDNISQLLEIAQAWFFGWDPRPLWELCGGMFNVRTQALRDRVESLPMFITSQHSALSPEGNALFTAAGTISCSCSYLRCHVATEKTTYVSSALDTSFCILGRCSRI